MLSAGDFDPTFGDGGLAYAPLGALGTARIAPAPGNKIAVVASTWGRYSEWVSVARLLADGSPDPSFGAFGSGSVGLPPVLPAVDDGGITDGQIARALAVQPDGKMLVAGFAYDEGYDDAAQKDFTRYAGFIIRLRPDGTPDPSFGGGDGIVTGREGVVSVSGDEDRPAGAAPFVGLAVLPNGKIVSARRGALFRFNPDGSPDSSFGGDGQVDMPVAPEFEFDARDLAAASDGSGDVLVLGSADDVGDGGGGGFAIARVRPDGTPATSLNHAGWIFNRVGGEDSVFDHVPSRLALTPDGSIVLPGTHLANGQFSFAVARYTPGGALDASFGRGGPDGDGVVSAGVPGGGGRGANDLAVLPDGRIAAAGNAGAPYNVVRFTADGRVDPAFAPGGHDGDGVATVTFPPDGPSPNPDEQHSRTAAFAVTAQPDGKVIAAAGDAFSDGWGSHGNVILSRFLADPPPAGARTYEAEQAALSGAVVSRAHPGFTGAGFVDYAHASGDFVEFTVDAPAAGVYDLAFRYAHGGTSPRAMGLRVAGAGLPGGVTFAPTGSWGTWNSKSVSVPLATGSNKVRLLASGQSGPNVDALVVTPVSLRLVVYQAEDARLVGAKALADQGGFTGTGYADFVHGSGDAVEFTVDAPSGGAYALDVRYANGGRFDRPLDLVVDGQALTRLSFAPTGNWRTWKTISQSVLLTQGRHTIRLASVGRTGPNLDALIVRPT